MRRISKDRIGAQTAHAAFFVMVSFIPFIMLIISMIKYLPVAEEKLLLQVVSVFPKGTESVITAFITESYEKSDITLISVTAISTLWAASIGVYSLVQGLNRVFCAQETRNFIIVRFMSMFYTLIVMALFILCLIVFVFGDTITEWLSGFAPWLFEMALVVQSLKLVVGVLALSLIFLGMFIIVPNRKTKLVAALPGALVAGIGWIVFSYLFSWYFESVVDFSYVYSSLSMLVIFMLWLFICIYILYIGAEINKYVEDKLENKALF